MTPVTTPRPRFLRAASLSRPFVDRDEILEAAEQLLSQPIDCPTVFNVVGIGGIGKSRLLQEIRTRAAERNHRTALLDLQIPVMRGQSEGLAGLRMQLGTEDGVSFDRFDIVYAVAWQRFHPHLRIGTGDLPFSDQSEALSAVIDAAAGVPVFGTAFHLLRLLSSAKSSVRRRRTVKVRYRFRALGSTPVSNSSML